MNEVPYIARFIGEELLGDAPLVILVATRIWHGMAAEDAVMPYITYEVAAGRDVKEVGNARILTTAVATVKVIGKEMDDDPPYGDLVVISNAIDRILTGAAGPVDGVVMVDNIARTTPFDYLDDHQYRHMGGQYAVVAYEI